MQRTRVSVVAFYSTARPVVIDTSDPEVIDNILDDLPLEHAFEAGKTNMYVGVQAAARMAETWRPRSTTLILASDGDTLPAVEVPTMPRSIASPCVGRTRPSSGEPIGTRRPAVEPERRPLACP